MEIKVGWFYRLLKAFKPKPKAKTEKQGTGYFQPMDIPPVSRTRTITHTKNTFIVNGKRLEPGTPEYESALADFMLGMDSFNKGMDRFNASMTQFGKDMDNMFKDSK